jgi:hypothetical protein
MSLINLSSIPVTAWKENLNNVHSTFHKIEHNYMVLLSHICSMLWENTVIIKEISFEIWRVYFTSPRIKKKWALECCIYDCAAHQRLTIKTDLAVTRRRLLNINVQLQK